MNLLEFFDRIGERRNERWRIRPPRPWDTRQLVAVLFFAGYYTLVVMLMRGRELNPTNGALVKDAMLILGPVIGLIGQAIFRSDAKDELATANTAEAFRAQRAQAEATIAAANTTPPVDPSAPPVPVVVTNSPAEAVPTTDTPEQAPTGGLGNVAD